MVLTMAAVAVNKGIPISRMAAVVEGRTEFAPSGSLGTGNRQAATHFVSHLDLGEGLTGREIRILYNSAKQCEVHKMLHGEITFEEHLEAAAP